MGTIADEADRQIGGRIRSLRKAAMVSQSNLAHTIGASYQMLQAFECGRRKVPASTLLRIAVRLERPASEFLAAEDGTPIPVRMPPRVEDIGDGHKAKRRRSVGKGEGRNATAPGG